MLACIIIPVHNRRATTLNCLERLRWCANEPDWKIVLVDDASTDGTGEAVRTLFPQVEIVKGDGNLFWTGAMRRGMARAMELGGTELVWLNDDTEPDETSLRRIVGLVREKPQRLIASAAFWEGALQPSCSLRRKPVLPAKGALEPADVLGGYQVAFSAAVVHHIGLPNRERWPHYSGDSSFTRTAHNAGFELLVDGGSFVSLSEAPSSRGVAETFWNGDETLMKRIRRVFFWRGSRYRVRSQWHLDCLYRGMAGALLVFPARLAVMVWGIFWYPWGQTTRAEHSPATL